MIRCQPVMVSTRAQAKRRLADEYDAAQERGEVATRADQNLLPEQKKVSVVDLGLTHKDIHEARVIRDAEEESPGIIRRALDVMLVGPPESVETGGPRANRAPGWWLLGVRQLPTRSEAAQFLGAGLEKRI